MADQQAVSPNAAQIEFWNSAASRAWADQYERMDRAVADLTKALLDMAAPRPGEHVLEIGCASGTTVLQLAARVGPGGHVLGADISNQSVARARQRIADAGSRHAEVIVADASCHAFAPNTFDLVLSRFGVMFFSDPQAAFANVRRAMKAGGRLALAVFRATSEGLWPNGPRFGVMFFSDPQAAFANVRRAMKAGGRLALAVFRATSEGLWPNGPLEAVRHLLPPIPTPGPEEPGPFSWADPTRVHRILEGAGFREVSLTPVDPVIRLASTGEAAEAADFVMVLGPLTRVLPALSAAQRETVRAALEVFFQKYSRTQGVFMPAANWLVQACV